MSGSIVFGSCNHNFTFYRRYRYYDYKVKIMKMYIPSWLHDHVNVSNNVKRQRPVKDSDIVGRLVGL